MWLFRDRRAAGKQLAGLLEQYRGPDTIVLSLGKESTEVAGAIAEMLDAPLEVFFATQISAPFSSMPMIGAAAEGHGVFVDPRSITLLRMGDQELAQLIQAHVVEIEKQARVFRHGRPAPSLASRTVIVVAEGLPNEALAHAAARAIERRDPARLILSAPIAAEDALSALQQIYDDVVTLVSTPSFENNRSWYLAAPRLERR